MQFLHDPLATGVADIQESSKTREIVSRSKTELWHRILTHYLPRYFPKAERYHRSSRTDWYLAFLEKYPTPHMITAMSRETFNADAWQVAGRKVSKERLLLRYLLNGVWLCGPAGSPGIRRRAHVPPRVGRKPKPGSPAQRDRGAGRRASIRSSRLPASDNHPRDRPDQRPDHPGRGRGFAPFSPSPPIPEVLRHGLATVQSGMFRGQSRISKYGNARLRRTFWMAGQVAVLKRTNSFRDKFERYIARDRHNAHLRRKAYTAIAAKMAHRTRCGQARRTLSPLLRGGEPRRKDPCLIRAVEPIRRPRR